MFKTLMRGTVVASLVAITALLGGLLAAPSAQAQAGPADLAQALVEALNADQGEAATSLLTADVRFTSVDGGSFGAFGQPAVGFIFTDTETDPDFHLEILSVSASGDTATGVIANTDVDSVAAGVDRYLQPFTLTAVDGKIAALDLTYDTSDAQTQTYLDFVASQEEDEEFPGAFVDLTLEGTLPGSAFVGDAAGFGATGISSVGVFLDAGSGSASVYEGTCDALGDVISPLAVLSEGGSFSFVSEEYTHLTTEPHAIAVSASETDSTIVACGNIEAAAPGPTGPGLPSTGMGASSTDGTPFASLAFALVAIGALAVALTGAYRVSRR